MLIDLIGNTPLVEVSSGIWAKLETFNPTGSIKDRVISYIFRNALTTGELKEGMTVVEATSGNTGIALSAICSSSGFSCKIIMPSNMSEERKTMMRFFGSEIIEVEPHDFKGAIALRNKMVTAGAWSPMQFENQMNIECHRKTTAREILDQATNGISAFISGAGTGGTLMGVAKHFKSVGCNAKIVFMRPEEKKHGIQGVGDGADYLLDKDLVDEVIIVKTAVAKEKMVNLSRSLGIPVGISSAANVIAAERYRDAFSPKQDIVTILCDRGERYMGSII